MFLHRIHLNLRSKDARRDLSDPYQLHSTLCRAFCSPDKKCPEGEFLWRLEPETDSVGTPRILVQSRTQPDWTAIGVQGWLAHADPSVDLRSRLRLDELKPDGRFRFRLRANPCVTRNGKRLGLMRLVDQESWITRQAGQHGFLLPVLSSVSDGVASAARTDVKVSQEQMLIGRRHDGQEIRIYSVLYDGFLTVAEPALFVKALQSGIGHGKAMGLGLLSVAPSA